MISVIVYLVNVIQLVLFISLEICL